MRILAVKKPEGGGADIVLLYLESHDGIVVGSVGGGVRIVPKYEYDGLVERREITLATAEVEARPEERALVLPSRLASDPQVSAVLTSRGRSARRIELAASASMTALVGESEVLRTLASEVAEGFLRAFDEVIRARLRAAPSRPEIDWESFGASVQQFAKDAVFFASGARKKDAWIRVALVFYRLHRIDQFAVVAGVMKLEPRELATLCDVLFESYRGRVEESRSRMTTIDQSLHRAKSRRKTAFGGRARNELEELNDTLVDGLDA